MQSIDMIEQLIEAHLDFLDQEFSDAATIQQELIGFYQWFRQKTLQELCDFSDINQLLQQQILATPLSSFLLEQIAEHLRFALSHDLNQHTRIADIIPVLTIDKIAQYIASKTEHRQRLIHTVVNNPAFSAMISQLIQHAIQDYLDNSVMVKHVPGVSKFMKMGKSVFENMTDAKLDNTIQNYLQKNILKLSQMSEHVLNQHFDQHQLYHFQANLWHKIKDQPLCVVKNYIEIQDLAQSVNLSHEIWAYLSQSEYLKTQLHDGVYAWYIRNQQRPFDLLLRDLNIDQALLEQQLYALFQPIIQQLIHDQYLRKRARVFLEKFYYSDRIQSILNPASAE